MVNSKRMLSLILALTMVLSMGVSALGNALVQFSDIDNHWAKEEIDFMTAEGVINGYEDGTFKPNNNMTRAEFIKVIVHLMGYEEKAEVKFQDVKEKDWFYEDVAKALAAGCIEEAEYLNPNELITREEVAKIIGIAFGFEANAKEALGFKDHVQITLSAKGMVGALKERGYIQGYEDGTFGPKKNITRAEVVKMLFNVVEAEGIPEIVEPEKPKAPVTSSPSSPSPGPGPGPSPGPVKVESIKITTEGNVTSVVYGKTLQLTASITPSNATNRSVTWEVYEDTGKASIDQNGLLTPEQVGDVTVKATAKDGSGKFDELVIKIIAVLLEDEDTGVSVEADDANILDPDTKLVVEPVIGKKFDDVFKIINDSKVVPEDKKLAVLFDIKLIRSDMEVQPNGFVRVRVKITEDMKGHENLQVVHIDKDNKVTLKDTKVEGNYIVFETDQFSNYAIVGREIVKIPEEAATMTNFNTHKAIDYKGINAGWILSEDFNFNDVESLMVNLYAGDELLVTNTAVLDKHAELYDHNIREFSVPFFVEEDIEDEFWSFGDWTASAIKEPTKVELVIKGKLGETRTFVNDNLANTIDVPWISLFAVSEVEGIYKITTVNELQWLAYAVNSGNDFLAKTIQLMNDLDLEGIEWTPIGTEANPFRGAFDGNNNTISNLNIDNDKLINAGLFGFVRGSLSDFKLENIKINALEAVGSLVGNIVGPVKNVEVKNLEINSTHWAGGIIGYGYSSISNCTVDSAEIKLVFDSVKNDNGDKAGGLIGYQGEGNSITEDCTVSNVRISGVRDVGGLVGSSNNGAKYINCIVRDSVVAANNSTHEDLAPYAGGVIGRVVGANTSFNCSTENVITNSYKEEYKGEIAGMDNAGLLIAKVFNKNSNDVYNTIQAAINAAEAGDTLLMSNGTFVIEQTLHTSKPLTIKGSGMDKTILDVTQVPDNSWGVLINKRNTTLSDMTIISNKTQNYNNNLKVSDEGSSPVGYLENIIIKNVSIKGGKGIDIHNANVYLDGLNVSDSKGASIAVSNGAYVTISDTTTGSGAWGSLGVMYKDGYLKSSVIILEGNAFNEGALYSESYTVHGDQITGLGNDWISYINDRDQFVWVTQLPKGAYIVSEDETRGYKTIQSAIDAAEMGDIIKVSKGTFDESIELKKSIQLIGSGAGETILNPAEDTKHTLIIGGKGSKDYGMNLSGTIISGFTINTPIPSDQETSAVYITAHGSQGEEIIIKDNDIIGLADEQLKNHVGIVTPYSDSIEHVKILNNT